MPEVKKWKDVAYIALRSEKTAEVSYWEEEKLKGEKIELEHLNLENVGVKVMPIILLHFLGTTTCTLDEKGVLTCRREVPT
jgi:hypothetical protein